MTRDNDLIGRAAQVADVLEMLRERPGVVTLTGPRGVGKSHLARAVVERCREFGALSWTIRVDEAPRELSLVQVVAQEVGIAAEPADGGRLREFLESRETIIVLDGCSPDTIGLSELVETLLASHDQVRLLIVSEASLNVSGERQVQVAPLATSSDQHEQSLAGELFAARAFPDGHPVSPWNARDIERVARVLGGIPLALEVVAVHARAQDPERMHSRLTELATPTSGCGDLMNAALSWVYEELSDQAQDAWTRLSVLDGSFTLECARALLPAGSDDEVIEALRSARLLRAESRHGITRLRIPSTVRRFGRGHVRKVEAVQEAIADYASRLGSAAIAVPVRGDQETWSIRADAERPVLRQALEICLQRPRFIDRTVAILFLPFRTLWWAQGYTGEVIRWSRRIAAVAPPDSLPWGFALVFGHAITGAFEDTDRRVADARRVAEVFASDDLHFAASYVEVTVYMIRGQFAAALPLADAMAVTPWARPENRLSSLQVRMDAHYSLGHHDEAAEDALRILRSVEPLREQWYQTMAMRTLALVRSRRGLHSDALHLARQALRIASESGITPSMTVLQSMALVAFRAGLPRLSAFLEGGIEANAAAAAFYRPILIASGDIPAMRRGLARSLGTQDYVEAKQSARLLPMRWLIAIAIDEDDLVGFQTPPQGSNDGEYRPVGALTAREKEVATLLVDGATNQQIASLLFISRRTVETHVARILRKLGVANRTELAGRVGRDFAER